VDLLAALDSFLHQHYGAPPSSGGDAKATSSSALYGAIILRAVEDHAFRERLLSEPLAVLAEHGIVLPEGVRATFVENTRDVIHIAIPPYIGE